MAFKHSISFATDLAAILNLQTLVVINSESCKTLFPMFCALPSEVAVRFESEQTPYSRTGSRFRPAALHRIRFGTCCFVAMSYFYSETND